MNHKELKIKFTSHATNKIKERGIKFDDIKSTILKPEQKVPDKFDKNLDHFIKKINDKYLRVIGKLEGSGTILVISSFYDRRIKRRKK